MTKSDAVGLILLSNMLRSRCASQPHHDGADGWLGPSDTQCNCPVCPKERELVPLGLPLKISDKHKRDAPAAPATDGIDYDFVEIGTSNFETLIQLALPETKGACLQSMPAFIVCACN